MPDELASECIDNDPSVAHPLDASGFLSLGRLDVLIEALGAVSSGDWMIAYRDGWSSIDLILREAFGDRRSLTVAQARLPLVPCSSG